MDLQSHHLFDWLWDWVTRTDRCRLLQQLAFSELRHFSWDNNPANTMAYHRAMGYNDDGGGQQWQRGQMATARQATMMTTLIIIYIVKWIILLICLQYNFYRQRLLPSGERTSRGSRAGAMQENIRGGGEDSSPACCSRRVSLTVDTKIFTFVLTTQLVKLWRF